MKQRKSTEAFVSDLKKAEGSLRGILTNQFKVEPSKIVLIQQGSSSLNVLSKELVDVTHEVEYGKELGFSKPTVAGHEGKVLFGFTKDGNIPVVILKGRMHLNEGYLPRQVAWPIFLFGNIGIRKVILTNAVGSTQKNRPPGSIGVISDHFNYVRKDPFYGGLARMLGKNNQFVPMDNIYHPGYARIAYCIGKQDLNLNIHHGKYLINMGPSFETKHEVETFRDAFGVDYIGMSLVMEAMASKLYTDFENPEKSMMVLALSGVSNYAAGISEESITHENNLRVLEELDSNFSTLIYKCIQRM